MTRFQLATVGLLALFGSACGGGGAGGRGGGGTLFQTPVAFPLGIETTPTSVAVADFNQDGTDDIAVANNVASTVTVVLGDGNGQLSAALGFGLGDQSAPTALAVGDFNRDGRPDLAVLVSESVPTGEGPELFHRVLILEGHRTAGYSPFGPDPGDFTVGAIVTIGSGYFPSAIVAADLDRDGDLDCAVSTVGGDDVQIILGNGDGTFASPIQIPIQLGFASSAIAVAHLDRDANLDLAVTSGTTGNVAILRGIGGGSFAPPTFVTVAPGAALTCIAVVQIDRAATPDIAVGDRTNQKLVILRGQGSGSGSPGFEISIERPLPMSPLGVVGCDFDRDGLGDVAVASGLVDVSTAGALQVCLGREDGTVAAPIAFESGGAYPVALAVGDLDRNGSLDVVFANEADNSFSTLLGTSRARRPDAYLFPGSLLLQTIPAPNTLVTANVTRDGRPDLVVAEKFNPAIEVFLGGGGTQFSPGLRFALPGGAEDSASLVVEDFDSDGDVDVILGLNFATRLGVFAGTDSDPVFTLAADISTFATFASATLSVTDMAAGDANRDGKLDLVVVDGPAGLLAVTLGNGDLTFAAATILPTNGFLLPDAAELADVDSDGDLDVVSVGEGGRLCTYLGNGIGAFAPPLVSNSPLNIGSILEMLVKDVNGDGKPDVVLASLAGMFVALGVGDGTFTPIASATPSPISVKDMVLSDLDLDGADDLGAQSAFLIAMFGNKSGTFAPDFSLSGAGGSSAGIVAGDWDRDGRPDLALLYESSSSILILSAFDG